MHAMNDPPIQPAIGPFWREAMPETKLGALRHSGDQRAFRPMWITACAAHSVGPVVHFVRADGRNARHLSMRLSPAPRAMPPYAVVCCDGTWMGPSDVHVQTAGAWEKSWMARDPGGPLATVSGEVPAMAPSRGPPRGTWPPAPAVSDLAVHTIREAAACSGLTRRRFFAGAERQPVGRATAPVSGAERQPVG